MIVDAAGGIYFTDPGPLPRPVGRKSHVYYLRAGATRPLVVDDEIAVPNGLTLTIDGKSLIVDDSWGETVWAFDVKSDGTLERKHPFAQLRDTSPGGRSGADGMALDREGRVYVSTSAGIQVFDNSGRYLGTIAFKGSNLAFAGPDKRSLFITTGSKGGLYRMEMLTSGPARLGK